MWGMRSPTPRQVAAAQGLEHYTSSKPCKRGHDSVRLVSSGACLACNRERVAAKRADNREAYNQQMREYRARNREAIAAANQRADAKRKESGQRRAYYRDRRAADPSFSVKSNLYRRINHALNGTAKTDSTMLLIGCTVAELVVHIESQWLPDMSWENYALDGWHIDHIRPCASFDLLDPEQQRECFHYTNLQPLWAEDNLRKGACTPT